MKILAILFSLLSLVSNYDESKYSINIGSMVHESMGEPHSHLLQDSFFGYMYMPRFYGAQTVRFKVSRGEMKFGECASAALYEVFDLEYQDNLLHKIKYYDKDGVLKEMTKFEYYGNSKIKHESTYNNNGLLVDEYIYSYAPGKMICHFKDREDGYVCVYDGTNKIIEIRNISDGTEKPVSKIVYANNKVSQQILYGRSGKICKSNYKYDSGNKLTEISYDGEVGVRLYYEGETLTRVESDGEVYEYIYDSSNLPICVIYKNEYRGSFFRIDIIVNF